MEHKCSTAQRQEPQNESVLPGVRRSQVAYEHTSACAAGAAVAASCISAGREGPAASPAAAEASAARLSGFLSTFKLASAILPESRCWDMSGQLS